MKTQEKDNELKKLIKGIKLDSPGNDFTTLVMNRVFEEKAALEKVKKERFLAKVSGLFFFCLWFCLLQCCFFNKRIRSRQSVVEFIK